MATILERATRLVKRMFSLYFMYVYLYLFYFDFDGKTVFLIHQLLVNDFLLLYYHVRIYIALSVHPCVNL